MDRILYFKRKTEDTAGLKKVLRNDDGTHTVLDSLSVRNINGIISIEIQLRTDKATNEPGFSDMNGFVQTDRNDYGENLSQIITELWRVRLKKKTGSYRLPDPFLSEFK